MDISSFLRSNLNYDSDDDIRRDESYYDQIVVLNSIREQKQPRRLIKPSQPPLVRPSPSPLIRQHAYTPVRRQPPPPHTPPRPELSNEFRVRIASHHREIRNRQIARANGIQHHHQHIQSDAEYERVLHQSLTDYKKPFRGLTSSEQKLVKDLARRVSPKIAAASEPCVICVEKFKPDEERTVLPCLHGYHASCIEPWFKENNTCPRCRTNISDHLKKCH